VTERNKYMLLFKKIRKSKETPTRKVDKIAEFLNTSYKASTPEKLESDQKSKQKFFQSPKCQTGSKSKETKRSQTKNMKRCEITIKNPAVDISPIYIRANSKESYEFYQNTTSKDLEPDLFITKTDDSLEKNENNLFKRIRNSENPKVTINVNILKWKLYNINLNQSSLSKLNKQGVSPFCKSRSSQNPDSGLKRSSFANSMDAPLRNVLLKPETYK